MLQKVQCGCSKQKPTSMAPTVDENNMEKIFDQVNHSDNKTQTQTRKDTSHTVNGTKTEMVIGLPVSNTTSHVMSDSVYGGNAQIGNGTTQATVVYDAQSYYLFNDPPDGTMTEDDSIVLPDQDLIQRAMMDCELIPSVSVFTNN